MIPTIMSDIILVMHPLSSINKAYSRILRVEKQREFHISLLDNVENNAMMAKLGISEMWRW